MTRAATDHGSDPTSDGKPTDPSGAGTSPHGGSATDEARGPSPGGAEPERTVPVALAGGFIAACGVLLAQAAFLPIPEDAPAGARPMAGAGGVLLLVLGAGLAIRGARRTALEYRIGRRGALVPLALFVLALLVGVSAEHPALLVAAHLVAAITPPLAIISAFTWRHGGLPARTLIGGLSWGALAAPVLAFVIEGAVAIMLLLVVLGALALPGGDQNAANWLQEIIAAASTGGSADLDAEQLMTLISQPAVIGAAFVLFALVGPLAEEVVKVIGLAFSRHRGRRGLLARGLTIGAGFALTESVLFGAISVGSGIGWAVVMLVRGIVGIMHATMTGLAALGWHDAWIDERLRPGLLRFTASVLGHGLWNALVLVAALGGVWLAGLEGEATGSSIWAVVPLIATAALVLMLWMMLVWLLKTSRAMSNPGSGSVQER